MSNRRIHQKFSLLVSVIAFLAIFLLQPLTGVAQTVFDDFEDGDVSDWIFFGGNNAGGGGGIASDRPAQGLFYLDTGWGGGGTSSGFYGGFFKNLDNTAQLALPANPWLNYYVFVQSGTSVDSFAVELTIREDTDGQGYEQGEDDSFRWDTVFGPSDFNDTWVLKSAPLSSFIDLQTGGNGVFDGLLDEMVLVIAQVQGPDPSDVLVDFDFIAFSEGTPLSVDDPIAALPQQYQLSQAYPNPFNPSTTIRYQLPKPSDVRLEVFNALGEKVRTLVQQKQGPGAYQVLFDATGLASGTYFYRLQAADFVKVNQMVLMK